MRQEGGVFLLLLESVCGPFLGAVRRVPPDPQCPPWAGWPPGKWRVLVTASPDGTGAGVLLGSSTPAGVCQGSVAAPVGTTCPLCHSWLLKSPLPERTA